jgi:hemoglobin
VTTAQTPYERLGGATFVRELVDRFYDLVSTLPEATALLALHPPDLGETRDKFFEFLSGWLGGPPLYVEKRGHPRLRMRHLPFPIDQQASEAWMFCMRRALEECVDDALLKEQLRGAFQRMADHMLNQGPAAAEPSES